MAYGGGGLSAHESAGRINACAFAGNQAEYEGGGALLSDSSLDLWDCSFADNTALLGGGMSSDYRSSPKLSDCDFSSNYAHGRGGALRCVSATVEFSTFSDNYAAGSAAVYCESATFINCTFFGNRARAKGSMIGYPSGSAPTLLRTIIAFNDTEEAFSFGPAYGYSVPTLICCDLYGNAGGDWTEPIEEQLGTNGNISADPLFSDPEAGEFFLWPGSPCHEHSSDCGRMGAWPPWTAQPDGGSGS
jgi:predicted outer membrane repeat protein